MLNLIILAFIAGLIGFLIARETKERSTKKTAQAAKISVMDGLREANPFARGRGNKGQFEAWLDRSETADGPLKEWYAAADDKAQKAFVYALTQFVGTFGFNLIWLNNEDLQENAPEIYSAVETVVNEYGSAYLEADGMKQQADVVNHLEKWQTRPAAHVNHDTTEEVYEALLAGEAITHELPEKGSARKKREAMVEAINRYRAKEPQAFYEVFTVVVNGETVAEAEEQKAAKPKRSKRSSEAKLATA